MKKGDKIRKKTKKEKVIKFERNKFRKMGLRFEEKWCENPKSYTIIQKGEQSENSTNSDKIKKKNET